MRRMVRRKRRTNKLWKLEEHEETKKAGEQVGEEDILNVTSMTSS